MKVLWLCNILPAFAASALGHSVPNVGGWLDGIYGGIHGEIELCICCPHEGNMPVEKKTEDLACYLFPQGADIPRLEAYFSDLLDKASPSIIHIFGTELPHSYAMLKASSAGYLETCDRPHQSDRSSNHFSSRSSARPAATQAHTHTAPIIPPAINTIR